MSNSNNPIESLKSDVKNWYWPVIIGVLFIALGIYMATQPQATYEALAWVFGLVFVLQGLFAIIYAITYHKTLRGWGWWLALGIISVILGVILLANQDVAQVTLEFYVAFMLLFWSVAAIAFSIELSDYKVKGWGWVLVLGILGLIVSFIMLWNPTVGAELVVIYAIIGFILIGILYIVLGFKLKGIKNNVTEISDKVEGFINKFKPNGGSSSSSSSSNS